jgi:hypothetical protein
VAPLVWQRLGDTDNYIEPFCGSAAVLLARPHPGRIETVNDYDCYISNFWRATAQDPEAVATFADGPVNEADLHARHKWLVTSDACREFRERMRSDPDYYDPKIAGWWCWGACCWIGSGWCVSEHVSGGQIPALSQWQGGCVLEAGVHGPIAVDLPEKRPLLAGPENVSGRRSHYGLGVHSQGPVEKRPQLHTGNSEDGRGVHSQGPAEKLPRLTGGRTGDEYYGGLGVHQDEVPDPGAGSLPDAGPRPQLADAYSRGRGVHGHDDAGTCAQRRAWLIDWFGRLRDRLRTVRVCCGDWKRVCNSPSVTTRLGVTGIFFDPPYSAQAGRNMNLYAAESGTVAHDVRDYCLERGGDPKMRIALCGYSAEGHEVLEQHGWSVLEWKAQGGYGNRSARGKANAARERIWFSPHCPAPGSGQQFLFDLSGVSSGEP